MKESAAGMGLLCFVVGPLADCSVHDDFGTRCVSNRLRASLFAAACDA